VLYCDFGKRAYRVLGVVQGYPEVGPLTWIAAAGPSALVTSPLPKGKSGFVRTFLLTPKISLNRGNSRPRRVSELPAHL
jgi:hypothetical protein